MSASVSPIEFSSIEDINLQDDPNETSLPSPVLSKASVQPVRQPVSRQKFTMALDKITKPVSEFTTKVSNPVVNYMRDVWFIREGDTFYDKTKRFIKADKYNQVEDRWSKWMLFMSILPALLGLITVIIWLWYGQPVEQYTSDTLSKKELDRLNSYRFWTNMLKYTMATTSFIAAVMHIRTLYRYNEFRNDVPIVEFNKVVPASMLSD